MSDSFDLMDSSLLGSSVHGNSVHGNSVMFPLFFLSIFVKFDSVHFKVKNASWVWFLAICFTMRIFLQIPFIFFPYFWLRYNWIITLFRFKPYDWYQAEPCGAPGHKSLSVSPISWLRDGLHWASMIFPKFQQGRFKQLLIREGRGSWDKKQSEETIEQP